MVVRRAWCIVALLAATAGCDEEPFAPSSGAIDLRLVMTGLSGATPDSVRLTLLGSPFSTPTFVIRNPPGGVDLLILIPDVRVEHQYTLTAEGFVAGQVERFGIAPNVTVARGDTVEVRISDFATFIPRGLAVTASSGASIVLGWNDVAGEMGYRIERCRGTDCVGFVEVRTTDSNVVTFQDTSLAEGGMYSYRIRAYYGPIRSGYSTRLAGLALPALSEGDRTRLLDAMESTGILGPLVSDVRTAVPEVQHFGRLRSVEEGNPPLYEGAFAFAIGYVLGVGPPFPEVTWSTGIMAWNGLAGSTFQNMIAMGKYSVGAVELPVQLDGSVCPEFFSCVSALAYAATIPYRGVGGTVSMASAGFGGTERPCSTATSGFDCVVTHGFVAGTLQFEATSFDGGSSLVQSPLMFASLPAVRILITAR